MVRSVRNQRYIYVRNYMPHLIYGQHIGYMFQTPTTQVWKALYDQGKLHPPQTYFWEPKPAEELYDLQSDPDEVHNLASSADHQAVLNELRQAHREHVLAVRDAGFLSEAEMHRRAGDTSIYELGHDRQRYPLEKIFDMAQQATLREPNALGDLRAGLKDADSGVRYWAAQGLLIRGPSAVAAAREDLRAALNDDSPTVRIVAARALGEYGNAEDLTVGARRAPRDRLAGDQRSVRVDPGVECHRRAGRQGGLVEGPAQGAAGQRSRSARPCQRLRASAAGEDQWARRRPLRAAKPKRAKAKRAA